MDIDKRIEELKALYAVQKLPTVVHIFADTSGGAVLLCGATHTGKNSFARWGGWDAPVKHGFEKCPDCDALYQRINSDPELMKQLGT